MFWFLWVSVIVPRLKPHKLFEECSTYDYGHYVVLINKIHNIMDTIGTNLLDSIQWLASYYDLEADIEVNYSYCIIFND